MGRGDGGDMIASLEGDVAPREYGAWCTTSGGLCTVPVTENFCSTGGVDAGGDSSCTMGAMRFLRPVDEVRPMSEEPPFS